MSDKPKSVREQLREARIRAYAEFHARSVEREEKILAALAGYYADKWLDDLRRAQLTGQEEVWISVKKEAHKFPSKGIMHRAARRAISSELGKLGLKVVADPREKPRHDYPKRYKLTWIEKK